MFSAIGGKNYVYTYQYQCQQRAKMSWKISLHQILAEIPNCTSLMLNSLWSNT